MFIDTLISGNGFWRNETNFAGNISRVKDNVFFQLYLKRGDIDRANALFEFEPTRFPGVITKHLIVHITRGLDMYWLMRSIKW